ncbi:MAG: RNA polymerase sigma-70 factor [Saprospiraceae bacterium]|nr:RNA polymerase sigma-70 factor [Saprospiraceae bacterium]MCB9322670.1 RNA polymerase sigma-70 factor [Lewinellaceae bacterium]
MTDAELLDLLHRDGEKAVEILFREHYDSLCRAVYRVLPKAEVVEDLVQDVFFELWRKHESLQINTSIKAYLRRAAVNKTLNYIRDQRLKTVDVEKSPDLHSKFTEAPENLEASEMQERIDLAIDELPEKCRMVFVLSRFEEKSYKEIAEDLDISVKTVENQISKALKILRTALDSFMVLALFVGHIPFF